MASALHLPGLSFETDQGVGARFVRRAGSVLRSAFAGITRRRGRRRSAAPPQDASQTAAPARKSPTPTERQRAPRRSRSVPPAGSSRPGWFARWFARGRSKSRLARRPAFLDIDDAPFTPEAHPGFTQEVCDLLNTPVDDLDPVLLGLTLAVFAQHLAESLPPELGMDARGLFSTLWDRLGGPLARHASNLAEEGLADETPANPTDAAPDAPPFRPDEAQSATSPESAATAAGAGLEIAPASVVMAKPRIRRGRPPRRGCCSRLPRGSPHRQPFLPPSWRLHYAACAGPP